MDTLSGMPVSKTLRQTAKTQPAIPTAMKRKEVIESNVEENDPPSRYSIINPRQ